MNLHRHPKPPQSVLTYRERLITIADRVTRAAVDADQDWRVERVPDEMFIALGLLCKAAELIECSLKTISDTYGLDEQIEQQDLRARMQEERVMNGRG